MKNEEIWKDVKFSLGKERLQADTTIIFRQAAKYKLVNCSLGSKTFTVPSSFVLTFSCLITAFPILSSKSRICLIFSKRDLDWALGKQSGRLAKECQ